MDKARAVSRRRRIRPGRLPGPRLRWCHIASGGAKLLRVVPSCCRWATSLWGGAYRFRRAETASGRAEVSGCLSLPRRSPWLPSAGVIPADGSAFAPRTSGWRKPLCLVLDLHSNLGQRLSVLPAVVSTEKQLPGTGEHNAYVRLGATPVANISGGQRLAWR